MDPAPSSHRGHASARVGARGLRQHPDAETSGGPGTETLTPALYSFQKAYKANNWHTGAASAWCIVILVVLAGAVYLMLARREDRE